MAGTILKRSAKVVLLFAIVGTAFYGGLRFPEWRRAFDTGSLVKNVPIKRSVETHDAKRIDAEAGTLTVKAAGPDPYFWGFAHLDSLGYFSRRQPAFLKIDYRSSTSGTMQVFFDISGRWFLEETSSVVDIGRTDGNEPGRVMVPVNRGPFEDAPVTDIRIDPPNGATFTVVGMQWHPTSVTTEVFKTFQELARLKEQSADTKREVAEIRRELEVTSKRLTEQLEPVNETARIWKDSWKNLAQRKSAGATLEDRIADYRSEQRLAVMKQLHLAELLAGSESDQQRLPNILVIVPDALNGRYLSCFPGGRAPRAMTPNIDKLAEKSIYFPNAISQGPWTPPSMMGLHTGMYPSDHRIPWKLRETWTVPSGMKTLPALLREEGYFTAAFVADKNSFFFERVLKDYNYVHTSPDPSGAESIDALLDFLKRRPPTPYFVFLHTLDPHGPYDPRSDPVLPPDLQEFYDAQGESQKYYIRFPVPTGLFKVSRIRQLRYIREIEELDEQLGRLFDYLSSPRTEVFDRRRDILVFTSDHGEEFEHENGFHTHGTSLYIETLRVPLMLWVPGKQSLRVSKYVENSGIFPTILRFVGIPDLRPHLEKRPRDLLTYVEEEADDSHFSYALSEGGGTGKYTPGGTELKTIIRSDGYKLIFNTGSRESQLYYLPHDPLEENEISGLPQTWAIVEELERELAARMDIEFDYPVNPGQFVGHAVPPEDIQELFGPPLDVVRKFGPPEELKNYQKENAK